MSRIEIVDYQPQLAGAVAEMWNNSKDGWGGRDNITTAEKVEEKEAASDHLFLFIALDGDKAVGYCKLSEFKSEEGALYIDLLNVRDEYHGQKIGKALVLKAVQKTIELGWPRVDLYTWAGNTKAVPLYKKCGFFWEERDGSPHLMNFIPTVLHTEAVQSFFHTADWYSDSQREIKIETDGRKENSFHYYEYKWIDGDKKLRMEFEREGKGLRLIETNDYFISASVEKLRPVFGQSYTITYQINNKSGKALQISLAGTSDKNISFSFQGDVQVVDSEEIVAKFYVQPFEEENHWRSKPKVITDIWINEKKATFQIGLDPQFPLHMDLMVPGSEAYIGVPAVAYLNLENKTDEDTLYTISLTNEAFISFPRKEIQVSMKPHEKIVYELDYRLNDFGYLDQRVEIRTSKINFEKRLTAGFTGLGAKFSGENKDYYFLYYGRCQVRLNKKNNEIYLNIIGGNDSTPMFLYPKLGKPYTSHLSNQKPESFQFIDEGSYIGFQAIYTLQEMQGIQLIIHLHLYGEGYIEHWYEVYNSSDQKLQQEIFLNDPIYFPMNDAIIPYQDKIIEIQSFLSEGLDDWNAKHISENWLFHKGRKHSVGICWNKDERLLFSDWHFFFEHKLGQIDAFERKATNPTIITLTAYHDWQELQSFARGKFIAKQKSTTPEIEWIINNHNPIVEEDCKIKYVHHHNQLIDGVIAVDVHHAEPLISNKISMEEKKRELELNIQVADCNNIQPIKLQSKLKTHTIQHDALLIKKGKQEVNKDIVEINQQQVFMVDNGELQIQAAPQFAPALISLQYKGVEWLDSSFPSTTTRSWWNPWVGGISSQLAWVDASHILKEECKARHTSLKDSYGNLWEGVKLTVVVKVHENTKGLRYSQYFLLLPGTPLLCYTTQIEQNSGYYYHYQNWHTEAFIKASDSMKNTTVFTKDVQKEDMQVHAGHGNIGFGVREYIAMGSNDRQVMLQMVTSDVMANQYSYIDKAVSKLGVERKLNLNNREVYFTPPIFYLLTDQIFSKKAVHPLSTIDFNI